MMKEIKDKSLDFVLRYYQAGKFDTQQATRRVAPAKVVPLWRKWAVATSVAALLFGSAYAAYITLSEDTTGEDWQAPRQEQRTGTSPTHHFHFDNTPLPDVLRELGDYYGVTLTTTPTVAGDLPSPADKRLTADFDSDSLDETIGMIEQVLDVRITKGF